MDHSGDCLSVSEQGQAAYFTSVFSLICFFCVAQTNTEAVYAYTQAHPHADTETKPSHTALQ